jgi:hypothetical protein
MTSLKLPSFFAVFPLIFFIFCLASFPLLCLSIRQKGFTKSFRVKGQNMKKVQLIDEMGQLIYNDFEAEQSQKKKDALLNTDLYSLVKNKTAKALPETSKAPAPTPLPMTDTGINTTNSVSTPSATPAVPSVAVNDPAAAGTTTTAPKEGAPPISRAQLQEELLKTVKGVCFCVLVFFVVFACCASVFVFLF